MSVEESNIKELDANAVAKDSPSKNSSNETSSLSVEDEEVNEVEVNDLMEQEVASSSDACENSSVKSSPGPIFNDHNNADSEESADDSMSLVIGLEKTPTTQDKNSVFDFDDEEEGKFGH